MLVRYGLFGCGTENDATQDDYFCFSRKLCLCVFAGAASKEEGTKDEVGGYAWCAVAEGDGIGT